MSKIAILYPAMVQVALTFFLLFWMGYVRVKALRMRQTTLKDIALRQPNWPENVLKVANCFHNQLEVPILFYVCIIFIFMTNQVDIIFVSLAWGFVLTRFFHAYIQTCVRSITTRFYVFALGVMILIVMWVMLFLNLITSGAV